MTYYKRFKKLYIAFYIVVLICIIGVLGFSIIEGDSFGGALFMTIINI